jgi:hypothetical protein
MAKRFTDNKKWESNWYMELTKDEKLLWLYMLDTCESNGIFVPNWKLINFMLDTNFNDFPEPLSKQIIRTNHEKKVFIGDFVKFQYGDLKSTSNLHKKIHTSLKDFGVDVPLDEGYETPKVAPKNNIKIKNKSKNKSNTDKKSLKSIDEGYLKELQSTHKDVDVEGEFIKFRDYLKSKGRKYSDYRATFRNWLKSQYVPRDVSIQEKLETEARMKKIKDEHKKREEQKRGGEFEPPEDFLEFTRNFGKKHKQQEVENKQ